MSIAASYLRNKIAGQANAGSPQENPCVAQLAGAATQQQTLVSDVDDVASHISEPVALTVAFLRDEVATAGTVLLQVVDAPNRHSVAVTLSETSSGTATVQNYGTAACMHRSCCFVTFGAAPAAAPSPPSRIGSSKKTGADGGGAAAAPRRKPAGPPAAHTIGIPALAAPPPPSSSHLSAVLTGALEPPPPPPPPPLPGVPPAVALRLCSRALPLHSECEEVLRLASAGGLPREAVKRVYHVHSPQLHERYMRGVSFAAASAGQAPPQAAAASASCHCALPAKRTPFERLLFHGSHHSCIANILCHGFDSGHDGGLIWFADQARSRLRLRQGQAGGAQRRLGQAALTAAQSCRALSTPSYSVAYCSERVKRHVDPAVTKRVVDEVIRLNPGSCTLYTVIGGASRHVSAYPEWVIVFDPSLIRGGC